MNVRPKTTENRGRNRLYSAIAKRQQEINQKANEYNIIQPTNEHFNFTNVDLDENQTVEISKINETKVNQITNISNNVIDNNRTSLKTETDIPTSSNNKVVNNNFMSNLRKEITLNQSPVIKNIEMSPNNNPITPTNPILLKHREVNKVRAQTVEGGRRDKPSGIEVENLYKTSQDENNNNLQKIKYSPNTIGPSKDNLSFDKNVNSLNE